MTLIHPTPQRKSSMKKSYFIAITASLFMIAIALLNMSSSPLTKRLSAKEEAIALYEFRIKIGERLEKQELDHYCLLLCEERGLCGFQNCHDAVALYRESALAYLKNTLKGYLIVMSDGRVVRITGEGLRHTLKAKNMKKASEYEKNIKFIDSTFELKKLLKVLRYDRAEDAKNSNCKKVHYYKGKLSGGYRIKVVVKESDAGEFTFYDYSLIKQ